MGERRHSAQWRLENLLRHLQAKNHEQHKRAQVAVNRTERCGRSFKIKYCFTFVVISVFHFFLCLLLKVPIININVKVKVVPIPLLVAV